MGWQIGTSAATGFIAGRAMFCLGAIRLHIHGSNVQRARIVIRSQTSTSGTLGPRDAWIRLPTSRMSMWATQGPMSGFPELQDHRHRICRWATGGGHGGVAGSVAAADTATSFEVPRVSPPVVPELILDFSGCFCCLVLDVCDVSGRSRSQDCVRGGSAQLFYGMLGQIVRQTRT